MQLNLLLLIIPNILINDDLALHEVKEPSAVLLRRHRRYLRSIIDLRFILVFHLFFQIEILQVVYYSYVINIFAALAHEGVSRTSSVEKFIVKLFIYRL